MMGTADENEAEKIGILADSHGQVDALRAGVSALMERDCSILYHLGDICDSAFPEKTAACLEIIKHHQVRAVKGNNEHTVSVNYIDREDGAVPQSAALFMGRLPLVRSLPGAVFCHSLPFE